MYRDEREDLRRDVTNQGEDISNQNFTGVNNESPVANTPVRVLTATSIISDNVKNYAKEDIGEIKNLMVNLNSGCVEYAVLEFGGFLGFGTKLFAIPFKSLQLDPKEEVFYLDMDKDRLKEAPGFDEDHWPQTNSKHWDEVNTYWDQNRINNEARNRV